MEIITQREIYTVHKIIPPDLYPIVKKLKIRQDYLAEELGYSKSYISRVMNGHQPGARPFYRLLVLVICKRLAEDKEEFIEKLKGTEWEKYLP